MSTLTTYLDTLPFLNEYYFIDTLSISKDIFVKTFLESNLEFEKDFDILRELLLYDFVTDDGDNLILDLEMIGGRS